MESTTSKILERLDYMSFKSFSPTEVVPDLDNAILYLALI